MNTRKIWVVTAAVMACAALWLGYWRYADQSPAEGMDSPTKVAANGNAATSQTTLQDYLSSYVVDKYNRIPIQDTALNEQRAEPQALQKEYAATQLVNRATADYFRYLQTHFDMGSTLQANTEAIRQHLLATLPKEDAEKLFALYQQFVDFEFTIGDKTKGWTMPESPNEALELIAKMQKLQQQTFGEENADLLFGGELKTMEYTARRSGILNDRIASGVEKEALLNKLAKDMFGVNGDTLDQKKNPYNLFEEKLLVYKNDLDKLEPLEAEKMIKQFRIKYLPASANSP